MDNGPGLLPFNLGPVRLTKLYHTFLQYINLDDIETKVTDLQSQLLDFKNRLPNDTYVLYELQIEYLTLKIQKIITHLNSLEPQRSKRGLVDSFGSVIKSLTGNLDYLDAAKYDDAIKTLQNNQFKISDEFNTHISLSKDWMAHHTNIVSQIVQNQQRINSTLELLIEQNSYRESSLIKYAKFAQLLTIITENTDDIFAELIRIENILAYIRTSSIHHTIINIDILRKMIHRLKLIYTKDHVLDLEFREYYNVIKGGYYFSGKRIVITFKFPIVSRDIYDLYKLSILPNKFNQSVIPPYPFIATNRNSFMYIETECPKVTKWFICEEKMNSQIRTQADCIQKIIVDQSLDTSCRMTTVSLTKEAVEKLDERHYAISFPQPTNIHTTCGREDFNVAQGSFLATIPLNCILRTNEFTISNINDHVEGKPMKIMKIPTDAVTQSPEMQTHIELNSIDLKGLHEIQDKVMLQPNLHLNSIPTTLYHTTVPFYGVLSSALVLITIICIRRYRTNRCRANPEIRTKKPEAIYAIPEKPAPQRTPATFALNVLK